jgi:GNAT superfamily N-acetyltransferase
MDFDLLIGNATADDIPRTGGWRAVVISSWPSHAYDHECVYPDFRRQSIGRELMETMLAWLKPENLVGSTLDASEDRRHVYESLGFEPSNEMG